jgi:hypothetical protein
MEFRYWSRTDWRFKELTPSYRFNILIGFTDASFIIIVEVVHNGDAQKVCGGQWMAHDRTDKGSMSGRFNRLINPVELS